MSNTDKLSLFNSFEQLFHLELAKIPHLLLELPLANTKAETIAEAYYRNKGYDVYRSRVSNGYRCIGTEFYWPEYKNNLLPSDKKLVALLKSILSPNDLLALATIVERKNGTPDFLLIKDNQLEFVEVKFNNELVKPSTVEFFLRHSHKWKISILRVKC